MVAAEVVGKSYTYYMLTDHCLFLFKVLYFFPFFIHTHGIWKFPGPRIRSKLQLWPIPKLQQCHIFNSLGQDKYQTCAASETTPYPNPLCHSGNSTIVYFLLSFSGAYKVVSQKRQADPAGPTYLQGIVEPVLRVHDTLRSLLN